MKKIRKLKSKVMLVSIQYDALIIYNSTAIVGIRVHEMIFFYSSTCFDSTRYWLAKLPI